MKTSTTDLSITIKTKEIIFHSIVESIMTYAAQVWVINKKYKGKILATERNIEEVFMR